MDKYIKQIQSRLIYRGIRASKAECRQAYLDVSCGEWEVPSNDQLSLVIERIKKNQKQCQEVLTITTEVINAEAITTEVGIVNPDISANSQAIEITSESHPDTWLPQEPEQTYEDANAIQEEAPAALSTQQLASVNSLSVNPGSGGMIAQHQVANMVSQLFATQPPEVRDQVTEYAMQRTFEDIRQVQSFLEQLRDMEFNLLSNTLQDHFTRRGSMLSAVNGVISSQEQKDKEVRQNFFNSFQGRLASFQQEMESQLSKQGV